MTNIYEDPAHLDARQSADEDHPTSRFRPTYRALSEGEKALHDVIKDKAAQLETLFETVAANRAMAGRPPRPREAALAMTKLEEAVMWAVKALTSA